MAINQTIQIHAGALRKIQQGHLWIFSNEISMSRPLPPAGSWCRFECQQQLAGVGYFNPHSLIGGRIVSVQDVADVDALIINRLRAAFTKRAQLLQNGSGRLLFAESDFLPGLIIDYFSGILVLQSNTAGIDQILPILEAQVPAIFEEVFGQKLKGMVFRGDSSFRKMEALPSFNRIVFGPESEIRHGRLTNHGVHYAADFIEGQKSGFFLDQTENREFLKKIIPTFKAPTVLDLFCYSGGWGLSALAHGAGHVTFVDESKSALELVAKGLDLNQISGGKSRIEVSDAFDYLEKTSDQFDIIISDPPAFAKSKKDWPKAAKAYEKLNHLAWQHLKPKGILISCSCSYHIPEADFMEILRRAVGKAEGFAHVIFTGGQAADHPPLLSMPETKYLKCVGLEKLDSR